MTLLNEEQRQVAKEAMQEYLTAPADSEGLTPAERSHRGDEKRVRVIEQELKSLLSEYLNDNVPLAEFKIKVDGINKRNAHWGFRGIKGQMFFNMVVNVADDEDECDQELKGALDVPSNDHIASSRIKTFTNYVKRIGEQWVEAGNTRYGCPKVGSIPFFLTFFWQVQDRNKWPVYYTNSAQMMSDLNLWQPSGDLAEDYLIFKQIHHELADFLTEESGRPFDLYEVEHVFWYKGDNPYKAAKVIDPPPKPDASKRLPESYVPPIISVLPQMACHEETLVEAAKRSGITLDRAFEKYINAAFTMLGYETQLLGQGKGRVPDGLALAHDESYAILWDAKVRGTGYSMGTDDRTIREYITKQSREMKKRRFLKNVYYLIISSTFADDYDDTIRSIKMETDVNEVCLVLAEALVAMVDAKLRAPLQITLGPDGIQRLFSVSSVLTAEMVREQLI